jgi:hypothetical protein
MMPYGWAWSSLQLTGQAKFWHPAARSDTSAPAAPAPATAAPDSPAPRRVWARRPGLLTRRLVLAR